MLTRMTEPVLSPIPCPTITVKGVTHELNLRPRDISTLFQKHSIDLLGKQVETNGAENLERTAKIVEAAAHSDLTWDDVMDNCTLAEIINAGTAVMGNVTAGRVKRTAQ